MSSFRLVVLLAVCAALGALLWLDRTNVSPRGDAAGPRAPAGGDLHGLTDQAAGVPDAGTEAHNPLASLRLDQLGAVVERPLFTSTRRPPAAIAPPARSSNASAALRPVRTFVLLGILQDDGGRRIALLREDGSARSLRVEAGDAVDGWQILTIEPDGLVMARGERQTVLKLPSSR